MYMAYFTMKARAVDSERKKDNQTVPLCKQKKTR